MAEGSEQPVVWVGYSTSSGAGKVHRAHCRLTGLGEGKWRPLNQVWAKDERDRPILDCESCGGRSQRD